MGFRFRKSINLGGGVRLNLSKKGVGISGGVKGARIGVGPRGVRTTTSIPGTGVSFVKEKGLVSSRSYEKSTKSMVSNEQRPVVPNQKAKGSNWIYGIILGAILLFSNPIVGVPLLALSGYFLYRHFQKPSYKSMAHYNSAAKLLEKNQYDGAIELLKQAVEIDSSHQGAKFLLGLTYHDKKEDYQNAIDYAQMFLDSQEGSELDIMASKFIIADSYFHLKEYDKTITILQGVKEGPTEEVEYERLLLIGRSFFEREEYELAIEQFKKGPILKRNITPHLLEFKYWLGLSYLKSGDKVKAKTQLNKVYTEDINYKDIQYYMNEL